MIELIGHALTLLQGRGVNLRASSIVVQCDNTPREQKNNPVFKFLGGLVRWHCCQSALSSLRTGHSHEDIDQCFGQLAKYLATEVMDVQDLHRFGHIKWCCVMSWDALCR